jgi:hypothetical protein
VGKLEEWLDGPLDKERRVEKEAVKTTLFNRLLQTCPGQRCVDGVALFESPSSNNKVLFLSQSKGSELRTGSGVKEPS